MELRTPEIKQDRRSLTTKTLEIYSNLIVLLPDDFTSFETLPYGSVLKERLRQSRYSLASGKPFTTVLPNPKGTRVSVAGFGPEMSAFKRLTLARGLAAVHAGPLPPHMAVACFALPPERAEPACEAVLAALLAADFRLPQYKSKPERERRMRKIHLYGFEAAHGFKRTLAETRGNNLARYLTALPPNELTPGRYRRLVERLAREYGWKREFFGIGRLRRLGAGAFLAVARGSPEPDAGILHLRYTPRKKAVRPALALVGKGICFDTGGTNLKSAKYMHGMHEDMAGSAVALGVLTALTELKADFPIHCWLALAQNHIGPKAYKPNEVVRAANGTTIEIVHTDAEGRLVLADALTLASRTKPKLIIDYATLTGACIGALSTRISGVLTNREWLIPALIEAGRRSGERVWPFPLEDDYEEALKSDVADIKQCILESEADHILAGVFLRKFLAGDPDWVHVDLSAGNHKDGLAHVPTDITGFGVRFTLALLRDQGMLEQRSRPAHQNT